MLSSSSSEADVGVTGRLVAVGRAVGERGGRVVTTAEVPATD
jgi:hypothetical protein